MTDTTAADAVLARVGLAPDTVRSGGVTADALVPLLEGSDGHAVADALGTVASPATAQLLADAEPRLADRSVRKAVRRALHRLAQQGIPTPTGATPSPPRLVAAEPTEGLVSAVDGRGDRVVWLVHPLRGGGVFVVTGQINEPGGLRDLYSSEMTRKQLRAVRSDLEARSRLRLVPADWRVVDALLAEAQARGGGAEHRRDYLRLRTRITTEPPAAAAEPISARVVPPAGDEVEALVAACAQLAEEPELAAWWPSPDDLAPFLSELAAIRDSPLVLSPVQNEERIRTVAEHAIAALYPPAVMARRFTATAYVLAERGRITPARQALAVAALVHERPTAVGNVPLLRVLVEQALGAHLASATSHREEERRGALVLTPGEALRARSPSRPPHTRG